MSDGDQLAETSGSEQVMISDDECPRVHAGLHAFAFVPTEAVSGCRLRLAVICTQSRRQPRHAAWEDSGKGLWDAYALY